MINSSRLSSADASCGSEWGCRNASAAADNETVVRIPIPTFFAGIRDCIFTTLLPTHEGPCTEPGYFGELGVSMVRMNYPSARVQHIPVDTISSDDDTSSNSSLHLLHNGSADIISYATSADLERMNSVAYTQLMRGSSLSFVMKDFNSSPPELTVSDLLMTPAGYWFLLITLLAFKFVSKAMLVRHRLWCLPVFTSARWEAHWRWLGKAYAYFNLVISLSLGLFMAGLANYFFVVFTRERSVYDFVNSEQTLLDGLRTGDLRALTFSFTLYRLFLNPTIDSKMTAAFRSVARQNPPIHLSGDFERGDALIQGDALGRSPKHVWVIWAHEAAQLRASFCGLHIEPDVNDHNWVYDTFYRSPDFELAVGLGHFPDTTYLRFPMSLENVHVYMEVRRRLQAKYFHRRQNCTFQHYDRSSLQISLDQVAGVFVFFLICGAASLGVLLVEIFSQPSIFFATLRRRFCDWRRRRQDEKAAVDS